MKFNLSEFNCIIHSKMSILTTLNGDENAHISHIFIVKSIISTYYRLHYEYMRYVRKFALKPCVLQNESGGSVSINLKSQILLFILHCKNILLSC